MGQRLETYENGVLISTVDNRLPLEVADQIKDALTDYRDNTLLENSSVWFNGYRYDYGAVAKQNISSTMLYIQLGQTLPETFTWRDYDNNDVPQNNASMTEFAILLLQYSEYIYAVSWQLKESIDTIAAQDLDTATILAQLDAFDITTGWPSNDLTPTVAHIVD